MELRLSAFFVLASFCPADAQIDTSLRRLEDGSTEIKIENHASLPVTAFAIRAKVVSPAVDGEARGGDTSFIAFQDPAIDSSAELQPNQERVLAPVRILCGAIKKQAPSYAFKDAERARTDKQYRRSLICELEQPIVAAVFADGSTTGDEVLLNRLLLRRSNMLLAIETTIETLSRAGRHNVPRDQLIADFKNLADSLNRWYLSDEQQIGRSVYQSMAAKMIALPPVQLGSPFPPSDFVQQESAALKERRLALVRSQPSLESVRAGVFTR